MAIALAVAFGIWGWADVRLRGTVDPRDERIHKTDFTVYTEAGAAFFDGRDPYDVANPRGWKYLYPPLFAMLVAPLHAFDPRAQVLIWFALSALGGWGCYLECVRIARTVLPGSPERGPFGPVPTWIGCAAVVAALVPALNCLQRGQVAVAKLYLLLLGMRLLFESRSSVSSFLAGAVLASPIVLKVTPLVPVGLVLMQQIVAGWHARPRRPALARAGTVWAGTAFGLVLGLLLVPAALVGWRANLDHLETWWDTAIRIENFVADESAGDSYSPRNQSLLNATRRLGNWISFQFAGGPHYDGSEQEADRGTGLPMDVPWVKNVLRVVRCLEGCLLVVVGIRTAQSRDVLGQMAAFGLACVSTLLLVAIARVTYFVLFMPAVMFLALWLLQQGHPRRAFVYAVIPGLLVFGHYLLLEVTGRIGLLGLGTTAWYTCASIAMLRFARRSGSHSQSRPFLASEREDLARPLAA